jgi:hypothetical protein
MTLRGILGLVVLTVGVAAVQTFIKGGEVALGLSIESVQ